MHIAANNLKKSEKTSIENIIVPNNIFENIQQKHLQPQQSLQLMHWPQWQHSQQSQQ